MSSNIQFTLVGSEDGSRIISVFVPGQKPQVADSNHPNFEKILNGVNAGDSTVIDLFDIANVVADKFTRLSDRVTLGNDRNLYLDGEKVDNSIVEHVVRFLDQGVEDWRPLVAFFENVQNNPNQHSREQLYTWLTGRDFTITPAGNIVGYKGVSNDGYSVHSGRAIVDGNVVNGRIPNVVGSVIEMPRSEVQHDPSKGCHVGLHIGTYEYASGWGPRVLEVHINPRDVVSVPTDSNAAKMRCCRYVVASVVSEKFDSVLVPDYDFDLDDGWGDGEYDYSDNTHYCDCYDEYVHPLDCDNC